MSDNVYYSPEKFGLTQIGMIDDPNSCYSFDDLVVWEHEDGRLFYAEDSGCSCPSPFEGYEGVDELNQITKATYMEFMDAVNNHCWGSYERGKGQQDPNAADKTELLAKVMWKLLGKD
jgi:hypothetical protein